MIINKNSIHTDLESIIQDILNLGLVQDRYSGILQAALSAPDDTHITIDKLAKLLKRCENFIRDGLKHLHAAGYMDRYEYKYCNEKIIHFIPSHRPTSELEKINFRQNIDFFQEQIKCCVRSETGILQWDKAKFFNQNSNHEGGQTHNMNPPPNQSKTSKSRINTALQHDQTLPHRMKVTNQPTNQLNITNKQTSKREQILKIPGSKRIKPTQDAIEAVKLEHGHSDDDMTLLISDFLDTSESNEKIFKNTGHLNNCFKGFSRTNPNFQAMKQAQANTKFSDKPAQVVDIQQAKDKRATKKPGNKITNKPHVDQKMIKNKKYYHSLKQTFVSDLDMPESIYNIEINKFIARIDMNPPPKGKTWLEWASGWLELRFNDYKLSPVYNQKSKKMPENWGLSLTEMNILKSDFKNNIDIGALVKEFIQTMITDNAVSNDWSLDCSDWIVDKLDQQANLNNVYAA